MRHPDARFVNHNIVRVAPFLTSLEARLHLALADLLFAAETDRIYAGGGHSLDFINKAFECLDIIGREHAAGVLSSIVGQMAAARGAEERTVWCQPIDLIALCQQAALELPRFLVARKSSSWSDHALLAKEGQSYDAIVSTTLRVSGGHEVGIRPGLGCRSPNLRENRQLGWLGSRHPPYRKLWNSIQA